MRTFAKNPDSLLGKAERFVFKPAIVLSVLGSTALAGCEPGNATPSETQSSTAAPTTEVSQSPNINDIPVEKQVMPEELAKYDNEHMSTADFEQLPIAERQLYASWLMRDKQEISNLFVRGLDGDATFAFPDRVSRNSTAQEASNVSAYYHINAITSHFNVNGIDGKSVLYDQDTAIKILSAGYADTTSQTYLDAKQSLIDTFTNDHLLRNSGVSGQASNHNLVVPLVTGDLGLTTTTVNGENVTLHGMNFTYTDAQGVLFEGSQSLEYVDFTDYTGAPEGTWVYYEDLAH